MLVASYYTLRVCSLTEMAGKFEFSQLTEALDKLYIISTPVILNMKTITTSLLEYLQGESFKLLQIKIKRICKKILMVVQNGKIQK